jgi:hypothetical protein
MYITAALTALKVLKKVWWLIPVLGLVFYIWLLNSRLDDLHETVEKKNDIIRNQEEELDFQCETLENQRIKIDALKKQSEEKEKVEEDYHENKKENDEVVEQYIKDTEEKNKKKDVPVMKRIRGLMPDKHNKGVK